MAELPAMPLWTDAYMGDTHHLTTLEHGAYFKLLVTNWRMGCRGLPDDDKQLARLAGLSAPNWARMRDTIRAFFFKREGRLHQKRQLDEWAYAKDRSKKQSAKAKARWNRDQPDLPLDDQPVERVAPNRANGASERSGDKSLKSNEPADATALPREYPHTHTHTQEDRTPVIPTADDDDDDLFEVPPTSRKTPLPKDWAPTLDDLGPETRAKVDTWNPGEFEAQCELFALHAKTNDRRVKHWRQALQMWLTKHHGDRSTRRNGYSKPAGAVVPNLGHMDTAPPGMVWDDVFGGWMDETGQHLIGGPTDEPSD